MKGEELQLNRLSIKGFKSIIATEEIDLNLGAIILLMDANGAGKSNIVNFFTMLNFMMSGGFHLYIKQYGTSHVFLHCGSNQTEAFKGKLIFGNNRNKDEYSFTLAYATPGKLLITEEKISWSREGQKPYSRNLKGRYDESALISSTRKTEGILKNLFSDCHVFQFHDTSATGFPI